MEDNIDRSIGRLEGKVDLVIGQVAELSNSFKNLESGRLSHLEMQVSNMQGRIAIIVAVASVVTSTAVILLEHWLTK